MELMRYEHITIKLMEKDCRDTFSSTIYPSIRERIEVYTLLKLVLP